MWVLPASEPASGSVRAKAPTLSSRAIGGSQRCFCSSLPSIAIERIASLCERAWTQLEALGYDAGWVAQHHAHRGA